MTRQRRVLGWWCLSILTLLGSSPAGSAANPWTLELKSFGFPDTLTVCATFSTTEDAVAVALQLDVEGFSATDETVQPIADAPFQTATFTQSVSVCSGTYDIRSGQGLIRATATGWIVLARDGSFYDNFGGANKWCYSWGMLGC